MDRDSICFGVYVDGVCTAGCDLPKVLSALVAVEATLDATGLQCSEVEADTSKQVFTGLQLDHKTGVLSLEASHIRQLRRGLKYAARQRHLTGDLVAKLIGHITWSCLLRRPALSLVNAGRRGRLWPAVARELRWIASLLPLPTCNLASPWSGSMLQMPRQRAKLMSWDCVMLVGKGRSSAPSLNNTCREVYVISLATFTILVCRWIASETDPADEPSRSMRHRPRTHSDVDQYQTSTTGLTRDSELSTLLSVEAARVAGGRSANS